MVGCVGIAGGEAEAGNQHNDGGDEEEAEADCNGRGRNGVLMQDGCDSYGADHCSGYAAGIDVDRFLSRPKQMLQPRQTGDEPHTPHAR